MFSCSNSNFTKEHQYLATTPLSIAKFALSIISTQLYRECN